MNEATHPIAAIQGGTSAEVQAVIRAFVAAIDPAARIAGLIEETPPGSRPKGDEAHLRNLLGGGVYRIYQDLGSEATGCAVDAGSIVAACEAVRRDIAAGCDLVVLNKFGRLESERTGLASAFAAAIEAETPILTSVAPKFDAAWAAFAAPLYVVLPPELSELQAWWREVAPAR